MKGGDQVVTKITPGDNSFTAHIDWQGDTTAPFLTEERRFTFTSPAKPFYLGIEMNSATKTVSGEADMNGDPEHAGAQFRPSELVDTQSTTYIFPGEKIDAHKVKDLPWAAEVFAIDGKTFTVVIFSHPGNLRSPTTWHARDYGLFAVNPFGLHDFDPDKPVGAGDYTIKNGDSLTLRYRFYFAKGQSTPEALDARFQDYANGK